ncbi:MAG: hypothetical protein IT371_10475 [Deltaproteobacteria bacterium]|nr:hypothetical protein [Deltaproteobacteria bacterium]
MPSPTPSRLASALLRTPGLWIALVSCTAGCPGSSSPIPPADAAPLRDRAVPPADLAVHYDQPAVRADAAPVKPDSTVLTTIPGGPCPCKAPLLCVKGACRSPCTRADCNPKVSPCKDSETCINTVISQAVCMPGEGEGKACDEDRPCAGTLVCIASPPTAKTGLCRPTCTSSCPGGGTCNPVPGVPCSYCAK